MLFLLATSVMAMDRGSGGLAQPLVGADLESGRGAAMPPTHSTRAVNHAMNHAKHVFAKIQKDEEDKTGLVAKGLQLGEGVKDEGSGHNGMVRAFERRVLVEFFFNMGWFDAGHFWNRAKPGAQICAGIVLG